MAFGTRKRVDTILSRPRSFLRLYDSHQLQEHRLHFLKMAISHFQLGHKHHKKPRSLDVVKRAASGCMSFLLTCKILISRRQRRQRSVQHGSFLHTSALFLLLPPFYASTSGRALASIAEHVLIPLFICLCVAAWFKMRRAKGKEERKRCSEAIDKRMSTIPTDWESISATGAQAAIRNSIAVSGVGIATFFSALTPFGLLASTLRMTMTQGTRGPIDVSCLLSGSGTLFSSPFTSRP